MGHRHRLAFARQQHEESPGVEPAELEDTCGHRIETVEGVEQPAVRTGGVERRPERAGLRNHSYTSAATVRQTQASSPRERQCS